MNNYHIDQKHWAQKTIFEQMGNIGAEVGRTIAARNAAKEDRFEAALARAIDLFDATIEELAEQKAPRLKEVLRAKYQFLSLFFAKTRTEDAKGLENYFMQFAIAARLRQFS